MKIWMGKPLVWLSLSALFSFNASATTHYVDANGTNPVPPYTDWSTAATNIQDAIDASTDGALVLVTNGVYATGGKLTGDGITNRMVVDKALTVQSVNGQTMTVIEGGLSFRCAYLSNGAVISGFTITNGTAGGGNGGGVWCASTGEQVLNCRLTKNSAWDGAGIFSGTVSNCTFSGNTATDSGGGAAYSLLMNCTLSGNTAGFSGWGGGAYNATANNCTFSGGTAGWHGGGAAFCTLNNCAIKNNTARYVGGGAVNSSLNNCTVTGNKFTDASGYGGGVGWSFGAGVTGVNNCIIYFNTDLYGSPNNYSGGGTLSYCCTTPLASGTGNFTDDPLFVNYASGDFHLATSSLCINTGGNDYVTNSTDLDGNPRLVADVVDVGAYECQTVLPVPVAPSFSATYSQVVTGFVVGFTGQIGGRPSASRWEFGDGTIISNQLPNVAHAWAAGGNYVVALRAYNDSYSNGVTATLVIQVSGAKDYYVRQTNAYPVSPYTSWATAATNIQTAVDAAYVGGTVWVSNGVYQVGGRGIAGPASLSNRVVVTKPLVLRSVNGPDVTFIQGNRIAANVTNNVRCVYLDSGTTLAGFTLTNGATRKTALSSDGDGGGIYCKSSTAIVSNCVIADNYATNYGGGIYSGRLYNCILTGNSGYYGGGSYGSILYNCVLMNNTAVTNGFYYSYGGGSYSGALTNCLLVGNTASYGGGAYNATLNNCTVVINRAGLVGGGAYNSTIRNSVLYYNAAPSGSNYSGSLTYCCAAPLAGGTGNISSAPGLIDLAGGNFRLQTNSPCIGFGNNSYVAADMDLDGRPRIVSGTVDMGAYEFQSPGIGEFVGWLQQYGLPTDGSSDTADTDDDSMNNYAEWKSNTNPTNALSLLQLAAPVFTISPDGIVVTWQSVANVVYELQRSSDLAGDFASLQIGLIGQDGTTSYTDTTATNGGPYFYRVGVQ